MANSIKYIGYILALIGGIILVITGGLGLLGYVFSFLFESPVGGLTGFGRDIIKIILGAISIAGSRYASRLEWAIILIVVGYFGGGLGGLLVLVGGILGLIAALTKRR